MKKTCIVRLQRQLILIRKPYCRRDIENFVNASSILQRMFGFCYLSNLFKKSKALPNNDIGTTKDAVKDLKMEETDINQFKVNPTK